MDAVIRRNAADGDDNSSYAHSAVLGADRTLNRRRGRRLEHHRQKKAPANVVQKERDKLADFQTRAEKLREQIERLG